MKYSRKRKSRMGCDVKRVLEKAALWPAAAIRQRLRHIGEGQNENKTTEELRVFVITGTITISSDFNREQKCFHCLHFTDLLL